MIQAQSSKASCYGGPTHPPIHPPTRSPPPSLSRSLSLSLSLSFSLSLSLAICCLCYPIHTRASKLCCERWERSKPHSPSNSLKRSTCDSGRACDTDADTSTYKHTHTHKKKKKITPTPPHPHAHTHTHTHACTPPHLHAHAHKHILTRTRKATHMHAERGYRERPSAIKVVRAAGRRPRLFADCRLFSFWCCRVSQL